MLLTLGAHARAPVLEHGEVWRLLAASFLHHSTFHLWSNVAGLLIIGLCGAPSESGLLVGLEFLVLSRAVCGFSASRGRNFLWEEAFWFTVGRGLLLATDSSSARF